MLFHFRRSTSRKNVVAFLSAEKTLTYKITSFEISDIDYPLDTVTQAEEFDLRGYKKSNSDEPYNTLPHAQQFDLQAETLELKK